MEAKVGQDLFGWAAMAMYDLGNEFGCYAAGSGYGLVCGFRTGIGEFSADLALSHVNTPGCEL